MSSEISGSSYIYGLIGFIAGLWLSNSFIFPNDALNTPLSDMTLGFGLRVVGGFFVVLWGGGIGVAIGEVIKKKNG